MIFWFYRVPKGRSPKYPILSWSLGAPESDWCWISRCYCAWHGPWTYSWETAWLPSHVLCALRLDFVWAPFFGITHNAVRWPRLVLYCRRWRQTVSEFPGPRDEAVGQGNRAVHWDCLECWVFCVSVGVSFSSKETQGFYPVDLKLGWRDLWLPGYTTNWQQNVSAYSRMYFSSFARLLRCGLYVCQPGCCGVLGGGQACLWRLSVTLVVSGWGQASGWANGGNLLSGAMTST